MPLIYNFRKAAFLCGLFISLYAPAQEAPSPAEQLYTRKMGYLLRLYNGTEYIRTYPNMKGHPFLAADTMLYGSITYEGVLYTAIPLNFDIVRGEVIVRGPQRFFIRVIPEKIDSFTVNGRRFVHLNTLLHGATGFYEVLHSGKAWALAKQSKRIVSASRPDEYGQFTPHQSFHLLVNGTLHSIAGRRNLLAAFGNKSEAVKKHLHEKNLNFRSQPEATLLAASSFFDTLQP